MGCAASGPAGSDRPSPQAQGAQRNSREDATNRGSSSAVDPIRLQRGQVRRGAESLELEDIIDDTFAFDFVLAHAESEFSSENIEFLIELRKLLQLQPSDKGLFKLSQKILKTHVQVGAELEVNLPPEVKTALLAWLKSSLSDGMVSTESTVQKRAAARSMPCCARARASACAHDALGRGRGDGEVGGHALARGTRQGGAPVGKLRARAQTALPDSVRSGTLRRTPCHRSHHRCSFGNRPT